MLIGQAIGHTQPQSQPAVVGNTGDAELAARRFIPAPQYKELVAARMSGSDNYGP